MFVVYQIKNRVNEESYIGFTSRRLSRRWNEHLSMARRHSQTHLHRAMRRYGIENFRFEILEEGHDPEIGQHIREPYWISVLKPEYNHTVGGEGMNGYVFSDEQNKANSIRVKASWTDERRKAMRKFQTGRKHSNEENVAKSLRVKAQWSVERKLNQIVRQTGKHIHKGDKSHELE